MRSSQLSYTPLFGSGRLYYRLADGSERSRDSRHGPPIDQQCRQALANIAAALAEAGSTPDDVVRVVYILPSRDDFEPCWPQLREFFGRAHPAATMIEAGLIDPRMRIEIEATARVR